MTALTGIVWHQVDVRGRCFFKCDSCGVVAQGDQVHYAPGVLVNYTSGDLCQKLSAVRGSSSHMPLGWSSHHGIPQNTPQVPRVQQVMTPERLAALTFQAENNGHTPGTLKNANNPPNPGQNYVHGSLIQITLGELREFLAHYPKEDDNATDQ